MGSTGGFPIVSPLSSFGEFGLLTAADWSTVQVNSALLKHIKKPVPLDSLETSIFYNLGVSPISPVPKNTCCIFTGFNWL